nr:polyphosphate polymerase domain-containing protein [Micromonospora sp. DSM 115978]
MSGRATSTAPMIRGFDPIGLDELMRRAPLLTRLDRKYLLPVAELPALLGGMAGQVRVLEIDQRRQFRYRSTYFDTPELESYLAAAHRRRRRFKLRVRGYLDSDLHYLEVKTRGRRDTTVKDRIPYAGDRYRLGDEAHRYADDTLAGAGFPAEARRFVPVLTTGYRRTTLFVPRTGSRVTVDTDLAWSLPGGAVLRLPDRAIVETKSSGAAGEVDRLLWSLKHRPCPVSKYATGLAALRAELPAHRWRPVLRRHFRTSSEERQP